MAPDLSPFFDKDRPALAFLSDTMNKDRPAMLSALQVRAKQAVDDLEDGIRRGAPNIVIETMLRGVRDAFTAKTRLELGLSPYIFADHAHMGAGIIALHCACKVRGVSTPEERQLAAATWR